MNSRISPEYVEQNRQLHQERPDYGTSGQRYAQVVSGLIRRFDAKSVLDYGAGKCTLQAALLQADPAFGWLEWTNYDPCIEGLDAEPEPADFVACTDVIEHVEEQCIDAVMKDLRRLTLKAAFLAIATRPAAKTLPDGRNAHLMVREPGYWLHRLLFDGWTVDEWRDCGGEVIAVVRP